jgi:nicotinate-nucleotide pyrophosphorylase (carboxylating)
MWSELTRRLIEAACEEDLGTAGDITSALLPESSAEFAARVVVREAGVICGLSLGPLICDVFSKRLERPLGFEAAPRGSEAYADGAAVGAGSCVATVRGPRSAVLTLERTLLNFLCRMSGVATLTRRYVEAARATNLRAQILDTRKTLPGWRELDKYAVRCGGGQNHRFGLHDAILIKDNHLAGVPVARLADTLRAMLERSGGSRAGGGGQNARSPGRRPSFVEVEVDCLEQLAEVCKVPGVDAVLLDNFTLEQMRAAVAQRDALGLGGAAVQSRQSGGAGRRTLQLEASGGVTLSRVAEIAATGVDRISVGALTHSATALDIALDA